MDAAALSTDELIEQGKTSSDDLTATLARRLESFWITEQERRREEQKARLSYWLDAAKDDLREALLRDGETDARDIIFELADNAVPAYNGDRALLLNDSDVRGADVDPGLLDGKDNLFDIIGVYIFTAAEQALNAYLDELMEMETCPKCEGSGYATQDPDDEDGTLCDYCQGDGEVWAAKAEAYTPEVAE